MSGYDAPTHAATMRRHITLCPRQDSNLRFRLRRPALYPLSYGGSSESVAAGAAHLLA